MYDDDSDDDDKESEKGDNEDENGVPGMNFGSIKEIKKAIKKQAAETVQNSKIFKMKNKIERIKDRKKAKRKKLLESKRQKWLKKTGRKK